MAEQLDLDAFMAKYVDTNIPANGKAFDQDFLGGLLSELEGINSADRNSRLNFHVLVSIRAGFGGSSSVGG